jgi:hypothetical protein
MVTEQEVEVFGSFLAAAEGEEGQAAPADAAPAQASPAPAA